jgi:ABC-type spermidine/putrescine transport system permease subunit II
MSFMSLNRRRQPRRFGLKIYAGFFFAFLYIPIVVLVALSFNDSLTMGFPFHRFTLRWYGEVFATGEFIQSLVNSLLVGAASALIGTALALSAAMSLRHAFPLKSLVLPLLLIPMITPGIVSGILMLVFFGLAKLPYGLWTGVLAAHVTWILPFAFLTLYPRLDKFDRSLEEAAMDLGANRLTVFFRIVLPLIRPAIVATLLFAFTLSFDEFIRTLFVIGADRTTPIFLWLLVNDKLAPYLPAVGVVIMVISIALSSVGFYVSARAKRIVSD